jgi:ArsR family transcriptional regulator
VKAMRYATVGLRLVVGCMAFRIPLTPRATGSIRLDMSTCGLGELERYAEIFKALSSPHRLAIFLRLVAYCPPGTTCAFDREIRECVGDVGRDLGIARTTVSHHVKELRRAGLLKVERRGRNIECRLGDETVRALIDLLSGHSKLKIHSPCNTVQAVSRKGARTMK